MWNIFETKWFHTMSCHLRNCEKVGTNFLSEFKGDPLGSTKSGWRGIGFQKDFPIESGILPYITFR